MIHLLVKCVRTVLNIVCNVGADCRADQLQQSWAVDILYRGLVNVRTPTINGMNFHSCNTPTHAGDILHETAVLIDRTAFRPSTLPGVMRKAGYKVM